MESSNKEKFDALRALNLPTLEYRIIGSGALGIRNLRDIGDIDICVKPALWKTLTAQYGEGDKISFPGGIIEAFLEKECRTAEIIDGLPFDTLETVLQFKREMGREKDLKDIQLIEIYLYKDILNLQNATFSRIDHADAMVATVYKINDDLILKVCERLKDYTQESYYLNFFAGLIPVPRIIQLVESKAILMECVPGKLLSQTEITDSLAFEMGAILARIHLNRTLQYDTNNLITKFEEGMDECKDHLPKELLAKCRKYFEEHVHLLEHVDGPCIAHRDFRAGNILAHEGKISGVIDWSSARSSFAEEDFCALEHGEFPLINKQAFLDGYSSIRPLPNYQAIMPLLRMHKALSTIGFTVKRNTYATKDAKVYQYNLKFLLQTLLDRQ